MGSAARNLLLFIRVAKAEITIIMWQRQSVKTCELHNLYLWISKHKNIFWRKKQYFCSLYHYVTKAKWRQCRQEFIAPSLPTLNSRVLKRVKVYIKFRGWQWQKVKQTCSNWTEKGFWTSCRLNVIYIGQIISRRPWLSTKVCCHLCLSYWQLSSTNTSGTLKYHSQKITWDQFKKNGQRMIRVPKKGPTEKKKTKE